MALVYKDRVKETTTTTGTGTITLAGAVTGYQAFSVIGNGNTCVYVIEDANGTGWEVGIGTYTSSGTTLARTTVLASSNSGSAITLSSGTHTVFCAADASREQSAYEAHSAITPGGRLTLTSGTPVTITDVTGATSIYYCPYVHDRITLWTGAYWQTIQFTEYTHNLGTVTSGKPYDVFAYLNSGALALEKLVWTDDTTRATAITLQDGRYCKSGDKTRLYLGTIYTTSTSATEDSASKRYVYNAYNKVMKDMNWGQDASHTYASSTVRPFNNDSSARVYYVLGLAETTLVTGGISNVPTNGVGALGTTSSGGVICSFYNANAANSAALSSGYCSQSAGLRSIYCLEYTYASGTFNYGGIAASTPC